MREMLSPFDASLPAFRHGVALYNARRFWDAHEAWETLWRDNRDTDWADFIQGLIQVAAAFHKLFVQKNPASAANILLRALRRLERYPLEFGGLALGQFVSVLQASQAKIATLSGDAVQPDGLAPQLTRSG